MIKDIPPVPNDHSRVKGFCSLRPISLFGVMIIMWMFAPSHTEKCLKRIIVNPVLKISSQIGPYRLAPICRPFNIQRYAAGYKWILVKKYVIKRITWRWSIYISDCENKNYNKIPTRNMFRMKLHEMENWKLKRDKFVKKKFEN